MTDKKHDFDNAAQGYDATFTNSQIGRRQRDRVYFWLNKINFFERAFSVFEINCGTGADAGYFYQKGLEVTATDQSEGMIGQARLNQSQEINFFPLDFSNLQDQYLTGKALFSNFGGLNCASAQELKNIAKTVGEKQAAGDLLVWVIMPRFCFMEGLYLISRLKFGKLFRRNTAVGIDVDVDGTPVRTYYHSPQFVKEILKPNYKIEKIKPVAFFLPPSYLEPFFSKRLSLLKILDKLENLAGRLTFLAGMSDHYIIIGKRK